MPLFVGRLELVRVELLVEILLAQVGESIQSPIETFQQAVLGERPEAIAGVVPSNADSGDAPLFVEGAGRHVLFLAGLAGFVLTPIVDDAYLAVVGRMTYWRISAARSTSSSPPRPGWLPCACGPVGSTSWAF